MHLWTPVRASVDARSCIRRTPVPVSVRTGVGWKLYYDVYRIRLFDTYTRNTVGIQDAFYNDME